MRLLELIPSGGGGGGGSGDWGVQAQASEYNSAFINSNSHKKALKPLSK